MATKTKGRTTIRTAAVCFMASALFEVLDLAVPVPFLGAMRSGAFALGYHLLFAGIFLAMGIGLWAAKPWGYGMVMAGVAAYTVDKLQLLAARQTLSEYIAQQFTTPTTREILALVPRDLMLQVMTAVYLAAVLCWWGFALYLHRRRAYFSSNG
jgi:hypothetical protein